MKKILILIFLSIPVSIYAEPFLISDPYAKAIGGKFEIYENNIIIASYNNQVDGSIRFDLFKIKSGTHLYKIRYVIYDSIDNIATSSYVSFQIYKIISCYREYNKTQTCNTVFKLIK